MEHRMADRLTGHVAPFVLWDRRKFGTVVASHVPSRLSDASGVRQQEDRRGDLVPDEAPGMGDVPNLAGARRGLAQDPRKGRKHIRRNPSCLLVFCGPAHPMARPINRWEALRRHHERTVAAGRRPGLTRNFNDARPSAFPAGTPGPRHALCDWPWQDRRIVLCPMRTLRGILPSRTTLSRRAGGSRGSIVSTGPDEGFTFEHLTGRRPHQVEEFRHVRPVDPDQRRQHLGRDHGAAISSIGGNRIGGCHPHLV
jgi:hypothetical protein